MTTGSPALSPAEVEAFDRYNGASAHAGKLRQGVGGTVETLLRFQGMNGCFDAVARTHMFVVFAQTDAAGMLAA